MANKLGIDVETKSKALLIRRLQILKGTVSAVDGGVYHEDKTYSQVHVDTNKTKAEMDDCITIRVRYSTSAFLNASRFRL